MVSLKGNFDRHNGNWGFLVDERTGAIALAPVFDCGSCLLPQADERIMAAMLAEVPYLTDLQRRFYRVYLEARRKTMF